MCLNVKIPIVNLVVTTISLDFSDFPEKSDFPDSFQCSGNAVIVDIIKRGPWGRNHGPSRNSGSANTEA